MLIANEEKKELQVLEEYAHFLAGHLTQEEWSILSLCDGEMLREFVRQNCLLDIACLDVEMQEGIAAAERIRSKNRHAYLLLVASPNLSPAYYLRPTIMAASLLLRPLSRQQVERVLTEAFQSFLSAFSGEDMEREKTFVIQSREGKTLVDFKQIYYFEAREKKIFLVTASGEIPFYETMERVQEQVPDTFVRCHRSFLVNGEKILRISLSEGYVYLEEDFVIPISRNNRKRMKEWSL